MEKPANNDHSIHELIRRRWSPLSFRDEIISDEILCSLFEAARWAPSSFNEQPWHFIVGQKEGQKKTYDILFETLAEGNQTWAETAPVLGMTVTAKHFSRNKKPNRHARHDVGLAMENLIIEALRHGIYVHQMAGFSEEQARERFEIPDGFEPVAAFALGYPGDPDDLPENLRKREESARSRKPLDAFVFSGEWKESSSIVK